jgi:type I restriction enzyme S subunit
MEKTEGSAQPNMNGKKLSMVHVPLPDSKKTQRRIVTYLDSLQAKVDELKRLQAETEKEIEELVPSILDKAFKGVL